MDWLLNHKEIFSLFADIIAIIGFIAIIFTIFQYYHGKKNLNFEVMNKCLEQYNNWRKIKINDPQKLKDYIEIVNLELFYFQHNYLPIEIAYEWIDGIIDVLPFFKMGEENLDPDSIPIKSNSQFKGIYQYHLYIKILNDYPRLKIAFSYDQFQKYHETKQSLNKIFNNEGDHFDRVRIVKKILKNLRILKFYNFIKHAKLNNELKIFSQTDKKYSFKCRIIFAIKTVIGY